MKTRISVFTANFKGSDPNQAHFLRNLWRNATGQNRAAAQATADAERRAADAARQQAAEAEQLRQQQLDEHNRIMQQLMQQKQQLVGVVAQVRETLAKNKNLLIVLGICIAVWYFFIRKKK